MKKLITLLLAFFSISHSIDIGTLYGLTNYTEPSIVETQKGGFFASGGGIYLRANPGNVATDPIFFSSAPKIRAGCGALDIFFGGIGFGGFDLLVQKFEAVLMNVPIVTFKLALAVLVPQLSTIIDSVETILNQLNSMQIDQCGRIRGIDVNVVNNAITDLKGAMTSTFSWEALQGNVKTLYNKVSDPSSWDPSNVVDTWNSLVESDIQGVVDMLGLSSPINLDAKPSLLELATEQLSYEGRFNHSLYLDFEIIDYVRAFLGDINLQALKKSDSGAGRSANLYVEPSGSDFDGLVDCTSVEVVRAGATASQTVYLTSSPSPSSSLSYFCPGTIESAVRTIYEAIRDGNSLNAYTNELNLLASVKTVPALSAVRWAAVLSSSYSGGNHPVSEFITSEVARALSVEITYAFFSFYISEVVKKMGDMVEAIASGSYRSSADGSEYPVAKIMKRDGRRIMDRIRKNASETLKELRSWRDYRLRNYYESMKRLVEKEGQLRNEAYTILRDMRVYDTYLRSVAK